MFESEIIRESESGAVYYTIDCEVRSTPYEPDCNGGGALLSQRISL